MNDGWADRVLEFWFRDLTPADWFTKSDATDVRIANQFKALHAELAVKDIGDLLGSAKIGLAAIIVLDQFSRNMFRGTAQSFATDALALNIAKEMVARKLDQHVDPTKRIFVYLPFEHSEDLQDQNVSVALIEALGDHQFTQYALAHRDVILQFGRFPHRNAVLGRKSTQEELIYLSQPGSGF